MASSTLQLNSHNFNNPTLKSSSSSSKPPHHHLSFSRLKKIRAVETANEAEPAAAAAAQQEPAAINFAFVSSVLLPDGMPDVHYRTACGGQKLRDIMLDNNVELYGPYARPLLNCGGGGTCGTCIVEVVEGRELLSPRTDKEKEKLKRNPKNWRLACQTTVGGPDSRGVVVIQQLPEWKAHEWTYGKEPPEDEIQTVYV
ncbi:Photosynthetic NDH subunit of subcomplex B 3, chloroplastic [Sesamum alatum]|uniref:Photosynthetic NDH subunit of subcomplex B 3, chloroplastic n=1 Tax=Sesamum alatum TaxID=300844 RepID=A0AAE1YDA9_9LAMI|nr:Photosynthetic NDH subunit of subcomplex B 3, chloroplastic [Sesamum alatum]